MMQLEQAREVKTLSLPTLEAHRHFDEPDDRTTDERHRARLAEDAYRAGVLARHRAIFARAAAGEILEAWERRIVENRRQIEAARESMRSAA